MVEVDRLGSPKTGVDVERGVSIGVTVGIGDKVGAAVEVDRSGSTKTGVGTGGGVWIEVIAGVRGKVGVAVVEAGIHATIGISSNKVLTTKIKILFNVFLPIKKLIRGSFN
jgi:hypothetical protein